MADSNQFKVILGADDSQLKAALNDAFKSVQDFAIKVGKLPQVAFSTQGIDNYKKSVGQLRAEVNTLTLNNLIKGLGSVNTSMSGFGTTATQAAAKTASSFQTIAQGAEILQNSLQGIPNAFEAISSGNRDLEKTAGAALRAGEGFESMVRPLAELQADLKKFKSELNTATDTVSIERLNRSIAQTNAEIKTLRGLGVSKVRIDADTKPVERGILAATALVDQFGASAAKVSGQTVASFQSIATGSLTLQNSLESIPNAFDQIAAGSNALTRINATIDASSGEVVKAAATFEEFGQQITSSIAGFAATEGAFNQITAAINEAETAAVRAGRSFLNIGVAVPNSQIDGLRANVANLKAELANGFKPILNVVDPRTPALLNSVSAALVNISPAADIVHNALGKTNTAIDASAAKAIQGGNTFERFAQQASASFAQAGAAASKSVADYDLLSRSSSQLWSDYLKLAQALRTATDPTVVQTLTTALGQVGTALGLIRGRTIVDLVDPKAPAILNDVIGSLVRITPATIEVNNALARTGASVSNFAVSINASLSASVQQFDAFKTEALQLGSAFDKIPASLKPFDTSSIVALRGAVQELKGDIATLDLKDALTDNRQPLASINTLKKSVQDLKTSLASGTNVKITLNSGTISRTLGQLEADLKNFKAQLRSATNTATIDALNKSIATTQARIRGVSGIGSKAFAPLKKDATGASFALTDLGRVAQDLPFGFVGIQNNINPLLESFGRLKAETGSTGRALKALAGSLFGVGGLGFALSVVSSAFLIFQNGIAGFNRKTKEAKDKTDDLADSFRDLATIDFEARGSVEGQIVQVEALSRAVQDVSRSEEERSNALKKLKAINKDYFGDITLQNAALGRLTSATDLYTESLIRQAIIKELEGDIGKIGAAYFRQQKIVNDLSNELFNLQRAQEGTTKLKPGEFFLDESQEGKESAAAIALLNTRLKEQKKLLDPLAQQYSFLKTEIEEFTGAAIKVKTPEFTGGKDGKEQDVLLKSLKNELGGINDRIAVRNKLAEQGKLAIFQENKALADQIKALELLQQIDAREVQVGIKAALEIDPTLIQLQIDQLRDESDLRMKKAFNMPILVDPNLQIGPVTYFEKLREAFENQKAQNALGIDVPLNINISTESNVTKAFDGIKTEISNAKFEDAFKPMIENFRASAVAAKKQMEDSTKQVFASIEIAPALSSALSAAGEAVGAALVSGANPFANAAEAFLGIIGSVVTQFGQQMIALGIEMAIAKAAIEASITNPAVAIAAGVALTILGGAMRNIKFNVPGAAEGGILTGPSSGYLAMLHGTEMVTPISKVGSMMGAQSVSVRGELIQRGEDLRYALVTTENKRRRK